MELKKTATIISVIAGATGLYTWYKNNQSKHDNTLPEASIVDELIGKTAYAANSTTTVYKAEKNGNIWTNSQQARLILKEGDTIGTVVAVVADPYIPTDIYIIIDIPFYVGSPTALGHGFIKLTNVKFN